MTNGFFGGFIRGLAVGCLCLGAASIYITIAQHPPVSKVNTDTAKAPSLEQNVTLSNDPVVQDVPIIVAPDPSSETVTSAIANPVTSQTVQNDSADMTSNTVLPTGQTNTPEGLTEKEPMAPITTTITSVLPVIPQEPKLPQTPTLAPVPSIEPTYTELPDTKKTLPTDPEQKTIGPQDVVIVTPNTTPQVQPPVLPQDPQELIPELNPKPALPTIAPAPQIAALLPDASDQTEMPDLGQLALEAFTDIETIGQAIELYAAQTILPDDRPLLALVLTATPTLSAQIISDLDLPITTALDPGAEYSLNLMEDLRLAGHEAAILADVSTATTPQDIDANLSRDVNRLPKTVAVIERQKGALQSNVNSIKTVPETLTQTGHGLLTYSSGLNTIARTAFEFSIPNAQITRTIPAGDLSNSKQIERSLENAMLDATRNGAKGTVIVIPATRPVLDFVAQWSRYDRTQRVQFVPLSQYLQLMSN